MDIVKYNFEGDMLDVVKKDDKVWVSVKRVCESLGIAFKTQHRKLTDSQAYPWACVTIMVTHDTDGRLQDMTMIDLDSLPMWLATIKASKVNPEIREKLKKYQVECAKVLRDHFFKQTRKLTNAERLLAMAQEQVRQERLVRKARKLAALADQKADESKQLAFQAADLAQKAVEIHSGNLGMYTVLGFANLIDLPLNVHQASAHGRKLSALCRQNGDTVGTTRDVRFGQVNTYPQPVLEKYFGRSVN